MRVARFLLLSVLGVAAVAVSAFMSWIGDRAATSVPVRDLFGFTRDTAGFFVSIGLVLLLVALVGLVATVSVSRGLLTVAGVVGLGVAVTWIVQALLDDVSPSDLQVGGWLALAGSALMLLSAWLGRAPRPKKTAATTAR
ncbi:MAG: hypothetical protein ACRD0A_18305 [Acidimicrobiales bacterium]